MYDYFDKHGKKLLAIVGSILALSFLLPAGFSNRGGGPGKFGKLDGQYVAMDDVRQAQAILQSADRILIPQRGQMGQIDRISLPQAMFSSFSGNDVLYKQVQQNPLLLYLLMAEARKAGAFIEDRKLDQFFATPAQFVVDNTTQIDMDKVNPSLKDGLREDVRRLMSIAAYFERAQLVLKISKPLVDDAVAREAEQVRLHVAAFNAKDFEAKVIAPADEDIRRQFDAYASLFPEVTDQNPFGFGYRVPDRVTAQWLMVPDAEVSKLIDATKSDDEWDVEARIYYRQHADEFQASPAAGVTPTTQPTTRPYIEARTDAIKAIKSPMIEARKRGVAARIVQQLNADYQKAAASPATQQTATAYGPAFGSFDYLQKLADAVQKQTGVRPTAVAPAGLLTEDELNKQPGGLAAVFLPDQARKFPNAARVIFSSLRPFQKAASATTLEVGQPSPIFTGSDGLYVVRVVSVDASHPPKALDEVKADVDRDVRRTRAFNLAAEAAQATLDKAATSGGLEKAGVAVQTSDFIGLDSTTPAGLPPAIAAGVIGPAFETLRGVKSPADLPSRTIARMRRDGIAAVVEVFAVQTQLNTAIEAQARTGAGQEIARGSIPPGIVEQWFNLDSVSRRTGYVPEARPAGQEAPAEPKNRPGNPLIPG